MESDDRHAEFLKLYVPMQLPLRRFVAAHVPGFHTSEDVFQEIALVLWRQFSTYNPAKSFEPWAYGIAWNLVMKARRKAARDKLVFNDDIAESLTERFMATADAISGRGEFLRDCMQRLSEDSRNLLALKYTERRKVEDIATMLGRTQNSIRMLLFRIRNSLEKCVDRLADTVQVEEVET